MENDWADEIVEKCRWMQGSIGALEMARQLRAAELRGRVKGMREAAEIAHRLEDQFETVWRKGLKGDSHLEGMSDGASQVSDAIFEAASKLSPTT